MARPNDRTATLVALVNAAVVYLLPLAFVGLLAAFAPLSNGSSVSARGPDYLQHQLQFWASYAMAGAPFAMAAAWRTFVHAKGWLERGDRGWRGVLEGGACGFAAALLILLPASLMHPSQAPPYLLAYGGLALLVGLAVGAILYCSAIVTLYGLTRHPSHPQHR